MPGSAWRTRIRTVEAFEALGDGELSVAAIVREGGRRYIPAADWALYAGDVLVVLADPTVVDKVVAKSGYEIVGSEDLAQTPPRRPTRCRWSR